jgi:tRNA pseudouridine38-40 synthase
MRLSVRRVGDRIDLTARADGFLHQMMRSLVGTLLAVGSGKRDAAAMPAILVARDRGRAWQIAPPHGLTLERVFYGRRPRRGEAVSERSSRRR